MQSRWILKPTFPKEKYSELQEKLKLSNPLMQLLFQRGIDTYDKSKLFFKSTLDDLHDPFLMKDMDVAVERIIKAINNKEKILVYGDYDVDGTTSVTLMYSFLKEHCNDVDFYIPDRYGEGYGISEKGINYAHENNFSLIISLDCGIKAVDKVKLAKEKGIDFVICDHHLPGDVIPDAVAVLDPLRSDCDYPFKFLSGCGVGFKLVQAIALKISYPKEKVYEYLDLVAVSVAADIVSLKGENRILTKFGIEKLIKNPRIGLKVLILKENYSRLNVSNIVFSIAPKINAAGRIDHASQAVRLLISDNETAARIIVSSINELNTHRKELDTNITEEALNQIRETNQEENSSTIVYNENWHKGVLGIVASRLTEQYYKPTLVFTKVQDEWVASARSIKDFDIYSALESCSDLIMKFGGHKFAAGLSVKEENFVAFRKKFELTVKNSINESQKEPSTEVDLELSFDDINPKFIRMITRFAPFGPGNMTPVFLSKNVIYAEKHRLMGKDDAHITISVYQRGSHRVYEAIGFNLGHLVKKFKRHTFDLLYSIDENIWQGKSYYRLLIRDVRFHED
ncbi:MAG: single-stranded-DNA-specific exonuclease RecJ [Flavobacteriales bacterium]|nr:single-stranded-DNA-specific exonuclease RecJ [Flavobacteriales bacterium]